MTRSRRLWAWSSCVWLEYRWAMKARSSCCARTMGNGCCRSGSPPSTPPPSLSPWNRSSSPLTQDLLAEAFAQLAGESQPQLTIRSMEDGVFYAEIVVDGVTFDARPSDVVAVAIRRGWPVHCPAELLDEVGISDEIAHVDEVEKFREFLDQVQPEDF